MSTDEQRRPAPKCVADAAAGEELEALECKKCGTVAGRVVAFKFSAGRGSRFVCPVCIAGAEAELAKLRARAEARAWCMNCAVALDADETRQHAKCGHAVAIRDFNATLAAPIAMRIPCPGCGALHIDEGEFASKPHHTHACQSCGLAWRPAVVATVGVRFLPGFKNEEKK